MQQHNALQLILLITLCSVARSESNNDENNPGFRGRITQRGLDYGAEVGLDLLMKHFKDTPLPPLYLRVSGSDVTLTDMVLSNFSRPLSKITTVPTTERSLGGLNVTLWELSPTVRAKVKVVTKWGFFFTSRQEGRFEAVGDHMSASITLGVGLNNKGQAKPININCLISGDLKFRFHGDFSSLINTMYSLFKSTIKREMFKEVCGLIKNEIETNLTKELSSLRMSDVIEHDYLLSYKFLRPPLFHSNYLETFHEGVIKLIKHPEEPPFEAPSIPQFSEHSEKMVYVYATSYLAQSGLYAAYHNNKLQWQITEDMLPDTIKDYFKTDCTGKACLARVFPTLSQMYNNNIFEVDFRTTKVPEIKIKGRQVMVKGEAEVAFHIKRADAKHYVFTVNTTILGEARLHVINNKIIFDIVHISPTADIKYSLFNLWKYENSFDSYVQEAVRAFIMPALKDLGETGIELPRTNDIEFINPVIVDHNIEDVFVAGTDLKLTPQLHF